MKGFHHPEETLALLSLLGIPIQKWKIIRSIVVSTMITVVSAAALLATGSASPNLVVVVAVSSMLAVSGIEVAEIPALQALQNANNNNENNKDE